jgi:alanyl-tRNA synthetase
VKIAKFDAQGKELVCVDAPHVANLLKDSDAIKKKAQERKKSMVQLYEQQVTQLNKQLEALAKRDKESNGGGNSSTRQRNQYESMLKVYQQQVKQLNDRPVESFITELTGQVKTVNAVAASKEFIFLICGEAKATATLYGEWGLILQSQNRADGSFRLLRPDGRPVLRGWPASRRKHSQAGRRLFLRRQTASHVR